LAFDLAVLVELVFVVVAVDYYYYYCLNLVLELAVESECLRLAEVHLFKIDQIFIRKF